MTKLAPFVWLCLWSFCLLTACHRPLASTEYQHIENEKKDSIGREQTDAISYYHKNELFEATDTLFITKRNTATKYSNIIDNEKIGIIYPDETIVLLDIKQHTNGDTCEVWMEVADNSQLRGWIRETHLLEHTVPDSPISKIINHFYKHKTTWIVGILLAAMAVWISLWKKRKEGRKVPSSATTSFYPAMLCLAVSFTAIVYSILREAVPTLWAEYYFHPTLNPLYPDLALMLRLLVVMVWLVFLLAIATIDDFLRLPEPSVLHIATAFVNSCMLFVVFGVVIHPWWGLPLWLIACAYLLHRHFRYAKPHYRCGNCQQPINADGVCPECGCKNIVK